MRLLARAFLLLLLAIPLLVIGAVWLCFQDAPSIVRSAELTPQDIENAKRILDQHDPHKVKSGSAQTIVISEQDLDVMLNYAANRLGRGGARVAMGPGTVRLQAST